VAKAAAIFHFLSRFVMQWMGERGDVCWVGKPERKRPLARSRRRWEANTGCLKKNGAVSKTY
jgi:hypothetical protein